MSRNVHDGQDYVTEITWIIHRNDFVQAGTPFSLDFSTAVAPKIDKDGKTVTHIIFHYDGRCNGDQDEHEVEPKRVCVLHCELGPAIRAMPDPSQTNLIQRRRKPFKWGPIRVKDRGRYYLKVFYSISVEVGPADLQFVLTFDGSEQERVRDVPKVQWREEIAVELSDRNGVSYP